MGFGLGNIGTDKSVKGRLKVGTYRSVNLIISVPKIKLICAEFTKPTKVVFALLASKITKDERNIFKIAHVC